MTSNTNTVNAFQNAMQIAISQTSNTALPHVNPPVNVQQVTLPTGGIQTTGVNINHPSQWVVTQSSSPGTVISFYNNVVNGVSINDSCTPDEAWFHSQSDVIISMLCNLGLPLPNGGTLRMKDGEPAIVYHHNDPDETWEFLPLQHRGVIDLERHISTLQPGSVLRLPDGNILEITKDGEFVWEKYLNARDKFIDVIGGNTGLYESLAYCHFKEIAIPAGYNTKATFVLPNGTKINLHHDDRIEIDDTNGKQLYKSQPVKDFNAYLNASDMLEDFIAYAGEQNITQNEFANLPISLFIYWLIVRAAEQDGEIESAEDTQKLLTKTVSNHKWGKPKCRFCGKFLSKVYHDNNIAFCNTHHMEMFLKKIA